MGSCAMLSITLWQNHNSTADDHDSLPCQVAEQEGSCAGVFLSVGSA